MKLNFLAYIPFSIESQKGISVLFFQYFIFNLCSLRFEKSLTCIPKGPYFDVK